MRRVSRGAIFWGAALITMGIVILLIQQGLVDDQLLANAGQWWPLLLIGVGVAVIFAGVMGSVATALAGVLLGVMAGALISGATSIPVSCGNEASAVQAYQDGSFDASGAEITVDLSCVTFDVAGGPGSDWAVQADEQSTHDMTVTSDSDSLDLHTDAGVVFEGRRHVALTVPADEGTNLDVSLNAGEATFDLADGRWGELDLTGNASAGTVDLSGAELDSLGVSLNAGSMSFQLDSDTTIGSVDVSANAGSVQVCAPEGMGLQVTFGSEIAMGHNLDEQGFTQDGDRWRSPGL